MWHCIDVLSKCYRRSTLCNGSTPRENTAAKLWDDHLECVSHTSVVVASVTFTAIGYHSNADMCLAHYCSSQTLATTSSPRGPLNKLQQVSATTAKPLCQQSASAALSNLHCQPTTHTCFSMAATQPDPTHAITPSGYGGPAHQA
eukprot:GHRQ01027089.1.p1 GENE.GHRQ01027089.1~~GHRQ01027089.1.p1  ORF type:complete len:145 (-),score=2.16 GHRQ01027089.1:510-944(-)